MRLHRRITCFVFAGLILFGFGMHAPPAASAPLPPQNGDTQVEWREGQPLEMVQFGALELPMQLIALQTTAEAPVAPQLALVNATRWKGAPRRVIVPKARAANGEELPAFAAPAGDELPDAPVFVLREGRQRGQHIIVVAISPLFQQNGVQMRASHVQATLPNTTSLNQTASSTLSNITAPPTNPFAAQQAVKLLVAAGGVQEVTGSNLAPLLGSELAQLRLWRQNVEVPLEIADAESDGRLGANDRVRFFARTPGDRWNAADTYWLAVSSSGTPRRVAARTAPDGTGTALTGALERGLWRSPTLYDSRLDGNDGDHWFAERLIAGPDVEVMSTTLTLSPRLPLRLGQGSYTVDGAATTRGQHTLRLDTNAGNGQITWSGQGNWKQTFQVSQSSPSIKITAVSGAFPSDIEIDSVAWELPVTLAFQNAGATFVTPTTGRYQLSNPPPGWTLYDITDPTAPIRVTPASAGSTFQSDAGREYLVTGPGTLHVPEARVHTPVDLTTALQAQVVYVAPSAFHTALQPLIAHRQAQGYVRTVAVDPQAIYDMWSYGQVAPEAIRSFFRSAYLAGGGSLVAATLVGDGTHDPFDYGRRNTADGAHNLNIIPPYLAPVDLWINETACDTCFAQLDGDSPLNDTLPDIALGRLPVKTADQVAQLVAKILRYETQPLDPVSASRVAYITDDKDLAGDFAAYAEASVAELPQGVTPRRMYYDPNATGDGVREPDSRRAYEQTLALLNEGPGVVNYIGHGIYNQWALTDLNGDPGLLLNLYDPDRLSNGDRLPIVLELTCLTSAFQVPNFFSTSIDERLVLKPDGGAIATWGSSGAGVAHGHDALQRGFYRELWAGASSKPTFGQLTQAGYVELLTTASNAQDALRTFLLLGDPLTRAKVAPVRHAFLPLAGR